MYCITTKDHNVLQSVVNICNWQHWCRIGAFEALAHPYFDELRSNNNNDLQKLTNGNEFASLFNFTADEIEFARGKKIYEKIQPKVIDDNTTKVE